MREAGLNTNALSRRWHTVLFDGSVYGDSKSDSSGGRHAARWCGCLPFQDGLDFGFLPTFACAFRNSAKRLLWALLSRACRTQQIHVRIKLPHALLELPIWCLGMGDESQQWHDVAVERAKPRFDLPDFFTQRPLHCSIAPKCRYQCLPVTPVYCRLDLVDQKYAESFHLLGRRVVHQGFNSIAGNIQVARQVVS